MLTNFPKRAWFMNCATEESLIQILPDLAKVVLNWMAVTRQLRNAAEQVAPNA